jgi:predicted transcriptional regulator
MPIDQTQIDQLISQYMSNANEQGQQDDRRRAGANQWMRGEFDRAFSAPAVSDEQVNGMFANMASDAGRDSLQAQRNARSMFGGAGITGGGLRQGVGTNIEMQRYGQLTQARNQTKQYQWGQNAAQNLRRQEASMGIGAAMSQPSSMLGMDALSDVLGLRLTQQGIEAGLEGARMGADATRDAADTGFWGDIAGGLLGLL